MWAPKLLFTTPEGAKGINHHCVYKSRDEYVVCGYFEVDSYLAAGFKRYPWDFDKVVEDLEKKLVDEQEVIESIDEEINQMKVKGRGRPKKDK